MIIEKITRQIGEARTACHDGSIQDLEAGTEGKTAPEQK
jgi:hypothetical protein